MVANQYGDDGGFGGGEQNVIMVVELVVMVNQCGDDGDGGAGGEASGVEPMWW